MSNFSNSRLRHLPRIQNKQWLVNTASPWVNIQKHSGNGNVKARFRLLYRRKSSSVACLNNLTKPAANMRQKYYWLLEAGSAIAAGSGFESSLFHAKDKSNVINIGDATGQMSEQQAFMKERVWLQDHHPIVEGITQVLLTQKWHVLQGSNCLPSRWNGKAQVFEKEATSSIRIGSSSLLSKLEA